jgi:hypothetical protein
VFRVDGANSIKDIIENKIKEALKKNDSELR